MNFKVALDIFQGPLDLLLYLVRKHELDILEIPTAAVIDQFLAHLEVLEQLDVNAVGDFVEMASTLIEIKSRMLLPEIEGEEPELVTPRHDLVRRLLEYKEFKDAASLLEERSRGWQERFARLDHDAGSVAEPDPPEPLHGIELWDLVSAFGRIVRDRAASAPTNIVYDDTPIHVYMERIHRQLAEQGRVAFSELFAAATHKSTLVGIFLAMLELVRHFGVRTEQDELFGEIWLLPGTDPERPFDPRAARFAELGDSDAHS